MSRSYFLNYIWWRDNFSKFLQCTPHHVRGRKTQKNNSHAPRAGVGHSEENKHHLIDKLRLTDSFMRFLCRNHAYVEIDMKWAVRQNLVLF